MPELESMIESKLIEQLVYGDSQWTYRADLKTEEDLWENFKYILEQNNKDRLSGELLYRGGVRAGQEPTAVFFLL